MTQLQNVGLKIMHSFGFCWGHSQRFMLRWLACHHRKTRPWSSTRTEVGLGKGLIIMPSESNYINFSIHPCTFQESPIKVHWERDPTASTFSISWIWHTLWGRWPAWRTDRVLSVYLNSCISRFSFFPETGMDEGHWTRRGLPNRRAWKWCCDQFAETCREWHCQNTVWTG